MNGQRIGSYGVKFYDSPSRDIFGSYASWNANLYLINNGRPVLRINYGFIIDYTGAHALLYNYYIYPQP